MDLRQELAVQPAFGMIAGKIAEWTFPGPDEEVFPGVRWRTPSDILSPAYWATLGRTTPDATHGFVCTDGNLAAEVGFCLLGGHGIKAEVATAAYERLLDEGAFDHRRNLRSDDLLMLLRQPFTIGGRTVRYRFPQQRSARIVEALALLRRAPPQVADPQTFRADLMKLPGVGPKTASWIVRNHTGSDEVAILDVHIVRACQFMSLFGPDIRLPRDYAALEGVFLEFAKRIGVGAGALDAIMWSQMRRFPLRILGHC